MKVCEEEEKRQVQKGEVNLKVLLSSQAGKISVDLLAGHQTGDNCWKRNI